MMEREHEPVAESFGDVLHVVRVIVAALRKIHPSPMCDELALIVERRASLIEHRLGLE